jgi:serine-type D-Ala-D-Ala carboxypeptidase
MLSRYSKEIESLLDEHIVRAGVAPGACAAVSVRCRGDWWTLVGGSGVISDQSQVRVSTGTWFDLASLTKPLVAFTIARHVDRGVLGWGDPLVKYAPWASNTYAAEIPIELMLAHRSGLAAHVDLAADLRTSGTWDRTTALLLAANSADPARTALSTGGYQAVYSDLGYILCGEVLSNVAGEPLDQVVGRELQSLGLAQLGSSRQLGLADVADVAVTEDLAWRGGRIRAIVHDDNAFALARDGIAGHAGMFGTVFGVARFACTMLDAEHTAAHILSTETCRTLLRLRPGGTERAGFDGKNPIRSSLGARLSAGTFGHYGFTGTGFWCDPDQQLAVLLLSNRICPSRANLGIRAARPIVHDELVALGLELRDRVLALAPPAVASPNPRPIGN